VRQTKHVDRTEKDFVDPSLLQNQRTNPDPQMGEDFLWMKERSDLTKQEGCWRALWGEKRVALRG
jgi:hypothetical protein